MIATPTFTATPRLLVLAAALAIQTALAALPTEDDLLRVALDAAAPVVARGRAFADLRAVATDKSIPRIAALLPDEQWSYGARMVLEALPGPAADRALLQALSGTSAASLRAGIINSLGQRRCSEAVVPIAHVLTAGEPILVEAALGALGDIASVAAVDALLAFQPQGATMPMWADALVRAGDVLQIRERTAAVKAYQAVIAKSPAPQLAAATIGFAHVADDPVVAVSEALASKRPGRQLAALALIRGGEFGPSLTAAVDRLFGTLAPDLQVQLLSVLQDRGDHAAVRTGRAALQSTEAGVRAAAARLLAVVGEETDALVLMPLMTGDEDVAVAARLALARLPGAAAERLLRETFRAGGTQQIAALEVIVARGDRGIVPDLLRADVYRDEVLGPHALNALAALGRGADLQPALGLYPLLPDARRGAFESVIRRIAVKEPDPDRGAAAILAATDQFKPEERRVSHLLLAAVGGDRAFAALSAAAKSESIDDRKSVLRALGSWRDTGAAGTLVKAIRDDPDAGVRGIAFRSAVGLYSRSAFGGGSAPVSALVPAAIDGLRGLWPLARQAAERNAVLVALRGLKDPKATAAAAELETSASR